MTPRGPSIRSGGARRTRYTRTQVLLHWTVAALVAGQYATSEAITRTHGMHMIGWKPSPADVLLHTMHNRAGLAIVALMVVRLAFRLRVGPPLTGVVQNRSMLLAQVAHAAFYAVLIGEGATGALASYLWWPMSAVHVILFKVLLGLVAVHVASALWQGLIMRDGTLRRMAVWPFRVTPLEPRSTVMPREGSR